MKTAYIWKRRQIANNLIKKTIPDLCLHNLSCACLLYMAWFVDILILQGGFSSLFFFWMLKNKIYIGSTSVFGEQWMKRASKMKTTSKPKTNSKMKTTSFWRLCTAWAYTTLVVPVIPKGDHWWRGLIRGVKVKGKTSISAFSV